MKKLNIKVLIAEDDESTILLLKMILRNIVTEVFVAKNGREAVEMLHQQPDIQLVLMDIMMPEMNGFEATRNIREQNNDVVIIAQTALTSSYYRDLAKKAGCNSYLNKPISRLTLVELIQDYFNNNHIHCN
ncbi:MAG TPA: response regulator [Bacteroidales bacterium]|nr:response regulator [Bacteroidales bacterium]